VWSTLGSNLWETVKQRGRDEFVPEALSPHLLAGIADDLLTEAADVDEPPLSVENDHEGPGSVQHSRDKIPLPAQSIDRRVVIVREG